jgi:hypothetical protein
MAFTQMPDREIWNRLVEDTIAQDDFEKLLEVLVAQRDDSDFADMLRYALVAMYKKGSDSGLAIMGKYFLAVSAEPPH